VTSEKPGLLDTFRTHLDLAGAPERVSRAWEAASGEERKQFMDRLLLETLLLDTVAEGRVAARRRSARWLTLAAAALLLIAIGAGVSLWRGGRGYPLPRASGDCTVWSAAGERVHREVLQRGDRVLAGSGGAAMSLGGYCELALGPSTSLLLQGGPGKEVVELEEGRLMVRVAPHRGQFRILTPLGHLEVVGTEFETTVTYPLRKGEIAVARMRRAAAVTVLVLSGLVAYQLDGQSGLLSSGMSTVFAGEAETPGTTLGRIVAGKPTLGPRDHEAWKDNGRIVGLLRQCPGCKVEALNAEGEVVKSHTVAAGGRSYELQWLSPATYSLRVTADGYDPLVLNDLTVKAKHDLRIDLEF
jgi:CubicO group peptidase (beta-lactamase class C family)